MPQLLHLIHLFHILNKPIVCNGAIILLPQAVRNVLPALGNELIAMLKDSALVSALGVQDITQLGKVYSASTFKFFETYSIVALLYLVMTLGLAMVVRWLKRRMAD